jgi:hypothetical protein
MRRARSSILQDSVKDVRNIRSEVKLRSFVNYAFRFTKGLVWRDTTHSGTTGTSVQFLQYWIQEFHLYRHIVTKNPFRGFTFKVCKMSGNGGDLIKGPSRRQWVNVNWDKISQRVLQVVHSRRFDPSLVRFLPTLKF